MPDPARLDEFDRNEMWDICHPLRPEVTREEFDRMWDEFQEEKAQRAECVGPPQ